ncbi:polyphenol oxidase F protein [Artemisia annua]|uniref:Polyphenol oxidase F protein n=1 Tax=Artemisia annua TaxID=35608 RepID=A0A2U1P522_ARTAN|nr:polyphenol oxidase F protein [Artemisia annua]
MRTRPTRHQASSDLVYVKKYRDAMAAMRALPDDYPHSWKNQDSQQLALLSFPPMMVRYVRILGSLINDPTFALPYWNRDYPEGMSLPEMFETSLPDPANLAGRPSPINNSLFEAYRNFLNLQPAILDFGRIGGTDQQAITENNLFSMYNQMITGRYYSKWVLWWPDVSWGNPRMANNEDMGNFYSAGYYPIFYSHHSNCDRMWSVWKNLDPMINIYPVDPDWTAHASESHIATNSIGTVDKVEEVTFPVKLDKTVKILVKRPAINRTKTEKKKLKEMLILSGMEYNGTKTFKFEVLDNDMDGGTDITVANSEFAGTFESLQHGLGGAMKMKSGVVFGITELLEDLKAGDDEYVLVTLVPKGGTEDVTISERPRSRLTWFPLNIDSNRFISVF